MRLVDRLYDWLSQGPAPDCDQVFATALPHAEPEWSERIIRILLMRGQGASWAALIGHYDRLTPEVQALLHYQPDNMQAGIARAAKSSSPTSRANALRALDSWPLARLSYLLPNAIRDPSPTVRGLAAEILYKMADSYQNRPSPSDDGQSPQSVKCAAQKQQLVLALNEAFQAYEVHMQAKILEACLWYARDLGDLLWNKLTTRRSHAAAVVSELLESWNHPRLAYFMVGALRYPEWRQPVGRLLRLWESVPEISALLSQSDLLEDEAIRTRLGDVLNPHWFRACDDTLSELPPPLRRLAPRWVILAGYNEAEKLNLLARWLGTEDSDFHAAVICALAEFNTPASRSLLKQAAESGSELAPFAGWSAQALDTEAVKDALNKELPDDQQTGSSDPRINKAGDFRDTGFKTLWKACRSTPPLKRTELMAALRENAAPWSEELGEKLQSADPRDRILVLQVISTQRLAGRFRDDIEHLLSDPVKGIRDLARKLLERIDAQPATQAAPIEVVAPPEPVDRQMLQQIWDELQAALKRLSNESEAAADVELMSRIRALLQDIHRTRSETQPLCSEVRA